MRHFVLLLLLVIPAWAQTPLQLFERTWSLVESDFVDPQLRGLDSVAIRAEAVQALEGIDNKEQAVGGDCTCCLTAALCTWLSSMWSWTDSAWKAWGSLQTR